MQKHSNNYTYSNQHPKIIEAGERLQKTKNDAFEASKKSKHIFAFVQAFIDRIGHEQIYSKEYFIENKEVITDQNPFYITSDKFPGQQKFIRITAIRPMLKYVEITIHSTFKDNSSNFVETFKFRYDTYIKAKNALSKQLAEIIDYHGIPNNYLENESRKDIWTFDFSKINFQQKQVM